MKKWFFAVLAMALLLTGCGSRGQSHLSIQFLSTGKSDCGLIRMDDLVILMDTADGDDYEQIAALLDQASITTVDLMILSHLDKDHIGSAAQLIENYTISKIIMPDYAEDSEEYHGLIDAAVAAETPIERLTEDYRLESQACKLWINAPEQLSYDNDNDYSLLTTIECGEKRLLLTGDALKTRLNEFNDQYTLRYDLIKLPHHGSFDKGLKTLLNNALPADAVVCCAADRATVEDDLLEELSHIGCRCWFTDAGVVTVSCDGEQLQVTQG